MKEMHPAHPTTDLSSLVAQLWQTQSQPCSPYGLHATLAFHLEARAEKNSGRELRYFLPAAIHGRTVSGLRLSPNL